MTEKMDAAAAKKNSALVGLGPRRSCSQRTVARSLFSLRWALQRWCVVVRPRRRHELSPSAEPDLDALRLWRKLLGPQNCVSRKRGAAPEAPASGAGASPNTLSVAETFQRQRDFKKQPNADRGGGSANKDHICPWQGGPFGPRKFKRKICFARPGWYLQGAERPRNWQNLEPHPIAFRAHALFHGSTLAIFIAIGRHGVGAALQVNEALSR